MVFVFHQSYVVVGREVVSKRLRAVNSDFRSDRSWDRAIEGTMIVNICELTEITRSTRRAATTDAKISPVSRDIYKNI